MTTTTDHEPDAVVLEVSAPEGASGRRRGRRVLWWALATLILGAVLVVIAIPFTQRSAPHKGTTGNGGGTSLQTVTLGSLSSQTAVNGTLGYTGSYSVVNQATGAITALPSQGTVISRGQVLYRSDGKPVVLLYGQTPAYRLLKESMKGADVQQLNANLVALGYSRDAYLVADSDYFGAGTKYALELFQKSLGLNETGELALGQTVFLPGAARITSVTATLGVNAPPDGVIAQATSIARQVLVQLDAAQQASVRRGDRVSITLPNNKTTQGVVTAVGKVASSSGQSAGSTVPVYIDPLHPRVTGSLDKAPVEVTITQATVHHALIVPVAALLALGGGGYAVEVAASRGTHRLVAVKLGLFDDADGLVQVTGTTLSAGEQVVVPST